MSGITSWLMNPLLLGGGALLMLVPIIIHLLNRRKFKIIDWAAMDFLLQANEQNRRRVRMENLILLLLRCLAVLLVGLLLARPFRPMSLAGSWFDSARFERIVVLDDSPSMGIRDGNTTAFERAKTTVREFVDGLAENASDDSLTLILSSRPESPLLNDVPLNGNTAVEVAQELDELQLADRGAQYDLVFDGIGRSLKQRSDKVNRVVYILSDLRERDWSGGSADEESSAVAALQELAGSAAGCFLVDAGVSATDNLAVTNVTTQEKALLAGLPARYEVTVRNFGSTPATNVPVKFAAGDAIPLTSEIDNIPPGSSVSVPFTHTVASVADGTLPEPVRITATIEPTGASALDRLPADNDRYYAARVSRGIGTLIVDGDPSAAFGEAESFFLSRALSPPGDVASAVDVETVTDIEFEGKDLDAYQVIFLCNVFRLSDDRLQELQSWVKAGGGLIVMPGNQIDDQYYATELYDRGTGLLPIEFQSIEGDDTEEKWVALNVVSEDHPVFAVFDGAAAPMVESARVFHWWAGSLSNDALNDGRINVIARFTDADQSPALVEMAYGDGRVVAATIPADTAWSNWPEEPGFLVTFQELSRYMARRTANEGAASVGEALRFPLDPARYATSVTGNNPSGDSMSLQPVASTENKSELVVEINKTQQRGFYDMKLNRVDGQAETILFAVNTDTNESRLERIDGVELKSALGDAAVEMVTDADLLSLNAEGARGELWKWVLGFLVVILCTEQFLAWMFSARR